MFLWDVFVGRNKQVSSISICKYNLLQKSNTLLESLYRPGKVSRLLRVQELRYRNYILYRNKENIYHKLEKKGKTRWLLLAL